MPNSDAENNSEVEMLDVGNVLCFIPSISKVCKETPVNFNPISVCEHTQLYRELDLNMVQESLGFNSVWEFCDGLSSQIKIIRGDVNYFFKVLSYLLATNEKLHT